MLENVAAALIDLDGVLYVEEDAVPGAQTAVNGEVDGDIAKFRFYETPLTAGQIWQNYLMVNR